MGGDVHFLAIDPGDVHNGVCYLTARIEPTPTLWLHWSRDLNPTQLEDLLENANVSGWVVESFHLYPEMAPQLKYSTFPTCERIGVCKYIARKRKVFCKMQNATVKPDGRRIGERLHPELGAVRSLGTARGSRQGWDWNLPSQHERDAMTHGTYWAFNSKESPLHDLHLAKAPERRAVICL